VRDIVTWWLAFPILTIAAERLELSRFLPPSPSAKAAFALILVALSTGLIAAPRDWGAEVFAAGLLALSAWLVKQDIARRTVRRRGFTRFIALCLLSGYAWLAVGGVAIVVSGGLVPGSPSYDAALHALALGFVFAMIFGHAPIIFPAVMRVRMPYHWTFYAPLGLLHLSLAIRLAGDVVEQYEWTRMGGLLNALALATFLVSTVTAVARGGRGGAASKPRITAGTDDPSQR
jgi:hypothetical protein